LNRFGASRTPPTGEAFGFLTVYAFSTENWSRPRDEVDALMSLFSESIRREVDELARRGIELRFSGRLHELSTALQDQIRQANDRTRVGARAVLNIAINYGGRGEIIDAVRELASQGADLTRLDEQSVAAHLYTPWPAGPGPGDPNGGGDAPQQFPAVASGLLRVL